MEGGGGGGWRRVGVVGQGPEFLWGERVTGCVWVWGVGWSAGRATVEAVRKWCCVEGRVAWLGRLLQWYGVRALSIT